MKRAQQVSKATATHSDKLRPTATLPKKDGGKTKQVHVHVRGRSGGPQEQAWVEGAAHPR
jgi:hypothetical protein